jgi:tetratricopeptide (TPR) repeat protein
MSSRELDRPHSIRAARLSQAARSFMHGSVRLLTRGLSRGSVSESTVVESPSGGVRRDSVADDTPGLSSAARALVGGSARFVRQGSAGSQIAQASPSPVPDRDDPGSSEPPVSASAPLPAARRTGGLAAVARAVTHGYVRFVRRDSSLAASSFPALPTTVEEPDHPIREASLAVGGSEISGAGVEDVAAEASDATRVGGRLVGISLAGLRAFIDAHGGRRSLEGQTTNDVKGSCVLPDTATAQCSYADVVRAGSTPHHIGRANKFISHVYSAPFLKAVDAVEAWEERQAAAGCRGPFFYYFDLFVVNQHGQSAIVPFDVLRDEFGSGVRGVGHTLLLMEWAEATALKRMWCVFELYTTLACGVPLDIIMAPDDETAFVEALHSDFGSLVQKTIIDAEHATAREPADEENIRRAVVESVGFPRLNALVIGGLQQWMAARGAEALQFRARTLGDDHPHTLTFVQNMGSLMQTQGRFADAERHFRSILESRRRTLGNTHPDTAAAMLRVCEVLRAQVGRDAEADAMFGEALKAGQAALDDDSARAAAGPDTLRSLLEAQSKVCAAVPRLREALALLRQGLGDSEGAGGGSPHAGSRPQSGVSPENLLHAMDVLSGAEAVLRSRISASQRSNGRDNPTVVAHGHILASLLAEQGRLAEAGIVLRDALGAGRRALDDVCARGKTLSGLAGALESLSLARAKLTQAVPLLRGAQGAAAYALALSGGDGGGGAGKNQQPQSLHVSASLAPLFSDCLRRAQEALADAEAMLVAAHSLCRLALARAGAACLPAGTAAGSEPPRGQPVAGRASNTTN